jgi:hypothetical protein
MRMYTIRHGHLCRLRSGALLMTLVGFSVTGSAIMMSNDKRETEHGVKSKHTKSSDTRNDTAKQAQTNLVIHDNRHRPLLSGNTYTTKTTTLSLWKTRERQKKRETQAELMNESMLRYQEDLATFTSMDTRFDVFAKEKDKAVQLRYDKGQNDQCEARGMRYTGTSPS